MQALLAKGSCLREPADAGRMGSGRRASSSEAQAFWRSGPGACAAPTRTGWGLISGSVLQHARCAVAIVQASQPAWETERN